MNQPGNTTTTTTTTTKVGVVQLRAVIGRCWCSTGAIISKKKNRGIIGGVAGAGIGAGTGAIIDGSRNS
jgi:hypothetical protein